jgi:hypothetical protein
LGNNEENKALCLALIKADSEQEVIDILSNAGYWDNPKVWRYYGDYENNFNSIGNQQAHPVAALVEKIINSVDARLMRECLVRGIDPESEDAPQSITDAVALFFENRKVTDSCMAGRIKNWDDHKRLEESKGITVAATGFKPPHNMCLTIADNGEGQSPAAMPTTFLSLTKSNKLRIPFVQGKFNMGGTGVLKFCGKRNLQLILSRRDPKICNSNRPSYSDWGFTIVRREDPVGTRRSSVYTYLAPIDAKGDHVSGDVLHFSADSMPIFPERNKPYARESEWGTLIKLYEYATAHKSHILRKDGLLAPVDLLLPELALPVRLHECRTYPGGADITVNGLMVRLSDNKGDNIEPGFPSSSQLSVDGQQITATIFVFKKGKSDTYKKSEGIIFTINGQTHGHLTNDFFKRTALGLGYLADSILVVLDCSKFSGRAREDLFMNSRDRLSNGPLRKAIEAELQELLKSHEGLRSLKDKRRQEELAEKLDDSKPLEEILNEILRKSPVLSSLFITGNRLTNPFKPKKVIAGEKTFLGKRYPTYFHVKGKAPGKPHQRECHINMRCRVIFETDAVNDYFSRDTDRGEFTLEIKKGEEWRRIDPLLNLFNGIATISFHLPEKISVGEILHYRAIVNDPTQLQPFINEFSVKVKAPATPNSNRSTKSNTPGEKEGNNREIPGGITLPNIIEVFEDKWEDQSPPFTRWTVLRITNAGVIDNNEAEPIYDFKINMDNIYLKTELKNKKRDEQITKARFKYGMVLFGLALIQNNLQKQKANAEIAATTSDDHDDTETSEHTIETQVEEMSQALAPLLIPMIETLGELNIE